MNSRQIDSFKGEARRAAWAVLLFAIVIMTLLLANLVVFHVPLSTR